MTLIQKLAWVYAAMFIGVVVLGYIPGVNDAQGYMFGLFKIDPIDDIIHLTSGIWAAIAAWRSHWAATWYFKAFGTLYSADAVVGLLTTQGLLDVGVLLHERADIDAMTNIAANLPHVVIGGFALIAGFILSRKSHQATR